MLLHYHNEVLFDKKLKVNFVNLLKKSYIRLTKVKMNEKSATRFTERTQYRLEGTDLLSLIPLFRESNDLLPTCYYPRPAGSCKSTLN